ncbi:CinA family protein [Pseudomonas borbori]
MQSIEQVVNFLDKYNLVLTTAESATAGLIASSVADIPGCASVLQGGFVVYSVEAKQRHLGVKLETIDTYGLTSEEVAREMAEGALAKGTANIALANTGMAASDDELDGVMCFACAMNLNGHSGVVSETVKFEGDRNEVRVAAAKHALMQLPYYYERLREAK